MANRWKTTGLNLSALSRDELNITLVLECDLSPLSVISYVACPNKPSFPLNLMLQDQIVACAIRTLCGIGDYSFLHTI